MSWFLQWAKVVAACIMFAFSFCLLQQHLSCPRPTLCFLIKSSAAQLPWWEACSCTWFWFFFYLFLGVDILKSISTFNVFFYCIMLAWWWVHGVPQLSAGQCEHCRWSTFLLNAPPAFPSSSSWIFFVSRRLLGNWCCNFLNAVTLSWLITALQVLPVLLGLLKKTPNRKALRSLFCSIKHAPYCRLF